LAPKKLLKLFSIISPVPVTVVVAAVAAVPHDAGSDPGDADGRLEQGCQMVCFQTKNPSLGKFWRVLQWKMLVYFMTIGLFYGNWKYFIPIWYILWSFGIFFPVWVFCT
jgi:hypothetical protein